MTPIEFFRQAEVTRLLRRAAACAAAPLSLHYIERGRENLRIMGWGQCAACQYVLGLPGGKAACRVSREPASAAALATGHPTPFLCHMKFTCHAVPALPERGLGFVLTFGPYCPSDTVETLEPDALAGLDALGAGVWEAFPVPLNDIHVAPATAVTEIAEWIREDLRGLWKEMQAPPEPVVVSGDAADEEGATSRGHGGGPSASRDPYQASMIAAALAAGNQDQARALVRAAITEPRPGERTRVAVRRARTAAVAAAVLEAAERAGIATETCWRRFSGFIEEIHRSGTDLQLTLAATGLLGVLKRAAAEDDSGLAEEFRSLNEYILSHLRKGITLNDAAKELSEHPTAITHRLQRKFGLSFTEYVGRLRVDQAKDLLRRTALSSTDIARRVGINDVTNFSKLFRKFTAMSPLDYRAQFRRNR